mgnify:CR=1 FL=1
MLGNRSPGEAYLGAGASAGESFFSVALFGVTRLMTPLPTPARILKGANLLKGAVKIISPIVWGEGLVRMFVPSQLREKWGWI